MKKSVHILVVYLVIGCTWIMLSDNFLLRFSDQIEIRHFQTYKGLFYVLSTGIIIFLLIRRFELQLNQKILDLESMNKRLIEKQEDILRSKKEYQELFDLSPLPMWMYCLRTFQILDVNFAAEKFYGYSKEEFLRMTIFDICDKRDHKRLNSVISKLENSNTNHSIGRYRHFTKKGEIIVVETRSNYVDSKKERKRLVVANDVTEFLLMQQKLKKLNQMIVFTEEKERNRIAGELHDGLIQLLVASKHMVSMLNIPSNDAFQIEIYSKIESLLNDSIDECRWAINDLRPKEIQATSFIEAVGNLINKYREIKKFELNVDVDESLDHQLDSQLKFNLFRIFQENLNNTLKHSNAEKVDVRLVKLSPSLLEYVYHDNGTVFNRENMEKPESFMSIKNRLVLINGTFFYECCSDKGLLFRFLIPVNVSVNEELQLDQT